MATPTPGAEDPCPCGKGAFGTCCRPLLQRARHAATPEELMRSRFTAYALGDLDHVFRTWHPRTRPLTLTPDPETRWTRLEVLDAVDDEVEFRAHHEHLGAPRVLHERSRFEQRRDRWVYVEAVPSSGASARS